MQFSNGYDIMKCPICEMNVWKAEYRPDVNIVSLHCQNCDVINIDIDVEALNIDFSINNRTEEPPY